MNKLHKEQIKKWILQALKQDPKKYGGDDSNAEITRAYTIAMQEGTKVENLPLLAFKDISTVSRQKNKLLREYPEYDFRRKYKPRKQKLSATKKILLEV